MIYAEQNQSERPDIILNFCGTETDLNYELKEEIKMGINIIASKMNPWIVTTSSDPKMIQLINDAIFEGYDIEKLTFISFDYLSRAPENLQHKVNVSGNYEQVELNTINTTYHYYIDDVSNREFNQTGVAQNYCATPGLDYTVININEFCLEFLKFLQTKPIENFQRIPVTCIVIQGGISTLEMIDLSINKDKYQIPILLVANTKGVPKLLNRAFKNSQNIAQWNRCGEDSFRRLLQNDTFDYDKSDISLKKYENKNLELFKITNDIIKNISDKNLVYVYYSSDFGETFPSSILRTIKDVMKNDHNSLKCALKTEGYDLFEHYAADKLKNYQQFELDSLVETLLAENYYRFSYYFNSEKFELNSYTKVNQFLSLYNSNEVSNIIQYKLLEILKNKEFKNDVENKKMESLVETALFYNNYSFIEAIIKSYDYDYFDWGKFLTKRRLYNLYNIDNENKTKVSLLENNSNYTFDFVKKYLRDSTFNDFDAIILPEDIAINDVDNISTEEFKRIINDTSRKELNDVVKYPLMNLFLWSVLFQRFEMAKSFWLKGESQINCALFASRLLKYKAKKVDPDERSKLLSYSVEFEKMAVSIINIFDQHTNNQLNFVILMSETKFSKIDNLQMAVECKCHKFVAQDTVQNFISDIWWGFSKERVNTQNLSIKEEKLVNNVSYPKERSELYRDFKRKGKILTEKDNHWMRKCTLLLQSPFFHYISNMICTMVFLGLFSHMLLYEFDDYSYLNKQTWNEHSLHITLTIWILILLFDEIYQFNNDEITGKTFKRILYRYLLVHKWNIFDVIGILLFIIGMVCYSIAYILKRPNELLISARIILCFDLMVWFFRSFQFLLVIERLGPKIKIIKRMLFDMLFFIIILMVFVFSFGVFTQSVLYPNDHLGFPKIIKRLLHNAFWPLFGEIKLLDESLHTKCSANSTSKPNGDALDDCLKDASSGITYVVLMIYMLLTHVLLINLLIAMFNSTYLAVHEETEHVWKFQRYKLTFEYLNYPPIPAPLSILYYIYFIYKLIKRSLCRILKFCDKTCCKCNNEISQNKDPEEDLEKELYTGLFEKYERKFARESIKQQKAAESLIKSSKPVN